MEAIMSGKLLQSKAARAINGIIKNLYLINFTHGDLSKLAICCQLEVSRLQLLILCAVLWIKKVLVSVTKLLISR
jgi:hypothetical protein